ncbi:MAG: hypothetical protein MZW92_27075 [Comamonadaceae bacterium]|nr:hypothetical protein [Comamonadaceae bacterium]
MHQSKRQPLLIVEDDPALQKQMKWALRRLRRRVSRQRPRDRAGAAAPRRARRW